MINIKPTNQKLITKGQTNLSSGGADFLHGINKNLRFTIWISLCDQLRAMFIGNSLFGLDAHVRNAGRA